MIVKVRFVRYSAMLNVTDNSLETMICNPMENVGILLLDDGRPSDAHVHAHYLRNEQCTCAGNLNNMAAG